MMSLRHPHLILTQQPSIGHPTDDAEVLELHIPGLTPMTANINK